jgi:hypothetical protein
MAVGADNREVLYAGLRDLINVGKWEQMVDFAVIARRTAIYPLEREIAHFAIEGGCALLLLSNDGMVSFSLKVDDQPPAPFKSCRRTVDVHVQEGGRKWGSGPSFWDDSDIPG